MAHNHLRPQFRGGGGYTPSFDLQEYGMHVDKTLIHRIQNKQILKKS